MFLPFLLELRKRGIPVGMQEAIALAGALGKGLHESSLDGFYHVARALLVHRESHLDAFDEAFLAHYRGVYAKSIEIHEDLLSWLRDAARRQELTPEQRALLQDLDPEELFEQLQQRLRDQKERHDGGNHWIGTGGTSPFGHGGHARAGIRVGGGGGNRSAIAVASARTFRAYRSDVVLDVRQMAVALRKLRAFAREGGERELDLEETVDATARNAGELEVVERVPRRPNTRVVLLMDVGGSMDPYAHLVSRLFTAASKATHFKELRSYYFHNCVYGRVYDKETLQGGVSVAELLATCGKHHKLIVVGDALMAPYELTHPGFTLQYGGDRPTEGIAWLQMLAQHFERSVWLNPEPPGYWAGTTIEVIARVFPMFPLTLDGLGEAVDCLVRGR
jgi:uncharacterized protein with von Willebrand factor type A (vWA) domain